MIQLLSVLSCILFLFACNNKTEQMNIDQGIASLGIINEIPTIHPYKLMKFSSADRSKTVETPAGTDNKDFNNFISVCGNVSELPWMIVDEENCEPQDYGYLLGKVDNQPGFISRLWFAKKPVETQGENWDDEMLEIYIDGQEKPVINMRLQDLDHGDLDPFLEPFAGNRSGGTISYFPISFNSKLRVYVNNFSPLTTFFYYHIDVTLVEGVTKQYTFPFGKDESEAIDTARNIYNNLGENPFTTEKIIHDTITISSSQSAALFTLPQDGIITYLSFTVAESDFEYLKDLFLKLDWKNNVPTSEVPLSAFFGIAFEPKNYHSLLLGAKITDDNIIMQSYIPMPSDKDGIISLLNKSSKGITLKTSIGWNKEFPPKPYGYFAATFNEIKSPADDTTHLQIAELKGKGKYLGTFYFFQGKADPELSFSDPFNFLEGDDKIIIDDTISLAGTGTEEIMDGAWYFTETFDSAQAGLNHKKSTDSDTIGEIGGYRWYLFGNEMSFNSSLQFTQEIGNRKPELAIHYRWVSYYYLLP